MEELRKDSVNNSFYELYGNRWYTAYDDPVAILRAQARLTNPMVIERIRAQNVGTKVLDVGCGGGFLSNALALEGLQVTGVDLSPDSINVARKNDSTKAVDYQTADAYNLPFPDASFDVVTAMDFLEHVERPAHVIKEFSRILKPGGIFIFHTFDRNFFSWLIIIKLVEWLVKNTPKNMHVLRLFIKPKELTQYCEEAEMKVEEMTGIKLVASSVTLKGLLTGVVPQNLRFEIMRPLFLSYFGWAQKSFIRKDAIL